MCFLMIVFGTGIGPETESSQVEDHTEHHPQVEIPTASKLTLGTVVRVIDGDSIIIEAHDVVLRYQILGADAPEILPKSRKPMEFAKESKRFLEQMILGEQVYLQYDPLGKRDRFKRWTVYLFRVPDMLFVNLELVRQGYAKHDPKQVSLHMESFEFYESKAKDFERGIWNPDMPEMGVDDFESEQKIEPEKAPAVSPEVSPVQVDVEPEKRAQPAVVVHITKYGRKYHRDGCPHLSESNRVVERKDLDESFSACKTCRPDGE